MPIRDADFNFVRELVRKQAAIVLEDSKAYLVEARLMLLIKRKGIATIDELVDRFRSGKDTTLGRDIVDVMTTNETSFFRDIHPFEMLKKHILPALMKSRETKRSIHIWSAASSTGQEAYSIAMLIKENFPQLETWDIKIVGTDLSREVLAKATAGKFTQLEVNRGLPATYLIKYFERIGMEWRAKESLRKMVRFDELNLITTWPFMPMMDIVFIRNVLIYFDPPTKSQILAKVRNVLSSDGYLLMGTAETTLNIDSSFQPTQVEGSWYYRPNSTQEVRSGIR